jgi:hypothetical protein
MDVLIREVQQLAMQEGLESLQTRSHDYADLQSELSTQQIYLHVDMPYIDIRVV